MRSVKDVDLLSSRLVNMVDYPVAYKWKKLEGLPVDSLSLARPESTSLSDVWREQRDHFSVESQSQFLERLQRQWAIETGIIERIYSLDRGITPVLIEQGIDAALIPRNATDETRFNAWLEASLVRGLEVWRSGL
jgi:hypothetical protein